MAVSGTTTHTHNTAATMGGGAAATTADAHAGGHDAGLEPVAPATGDPRFMDKTTGPTRPKDKSMKVDIPDGPGYGGLKGRKQNAGDKRQNNYTETDANFFPNLGLLPADPDTGKPMTYVQHIQAYNAAGYIKSFAPDTYRVLVKNQNEGRGTILGASLHLMGITQTADPAEAGADASLIPATVPGTNGALNARDVVMDPEDITGQQWARPHHAESGWDMYKNLLGAGLDWKTAMTLSGDDAVSGAGRLNGFNNQDGSDSFNADEKAVFQLGAQIGQMTGKDVLGIMMNGHNHTGIHESAMTDPNINKILGLPEGDRSGSPQRVAALQAALMNGGVKGYSSEGTIKKFDSEAKGAYTNVGGVSGVIDQALATAPTKVEAPKAAGGGQTANVPTDQTVIGPTAAPAAAPAMDALGGAAAITGSATGIEALLQQILAMLSQLMIMMQQLAATLGSPTSQQVATAAPAAIAAPTAQAQDGAALAMAPSAAPAGVTTAADQVVTGAATMPTDVPMAA